MSESLSSDYLTAEERAYMNGGGDVPPPGSDASDAEPKPKPEAEEPKDEPEEPATEQDGDDTDPDAEPEASGDKKPRKVGWSAYQRVKADAAERAKQVEEIRQRAEAREREFAAYQARSEERFRMLTEAQQRANAPQPEPPKAPMPEPDPEMDPLGHLRWQREKLAEAEAKISQFEQYQTQTVEQQRQTQQIRQLDDAYRGDNLAAVREQPEYPAAYNHLLAISERELQHQYGGRLTPQQVKTMIDQQERQLAANAFQQGLRPSVVIWNMALERGFRPTAAQQAAHEQATAQQPDPAAEQARIDAAARGQAQNRSLSSAGRSGGAASEMTAEKFVNLSDAEAAKWMAENPERFARMTGGR